VDTVLIVEDEPLIAWTVEDDLTDAGYNVVVATNADQALELLESRSDITTVFTDVDMPGTLDGLTLSACVSRRWPQLKIIITTGKQPPDPTHMPKGSTFLPKPYLVDQLRAAIAA
jgi:DNA-binding NtrC family response regulator